MTIRGWCYFWDVYDLLFNHIWFKTMLIPLDENKGLFRNYLYFFKSFFSNKIRICLFILVSVIITIDPLSRITLTIYHNFKGQPDLSIFGIKTNFFWVFKQPELTKKNTKIYHGLNYWNSLHITLLVFETRKKAEIFFNRNKELLLKNNEKDSNFFGEKLDDNLFTCGFINETDTCYTSIFCLYDNIQIEIIQILKKRDCKTKDDLAEILLSFI